MDDPNNNQNQDASSNPNPLGAAGDQPPTNSAIPPWVPSSDPVQAASTTTGTPNLVADSGINPIPDSASTAEVPIPTFQPPQQSADPLNPIEPSASPPFSLDTTTPIPSSFNPLMPNNSQPTINPAAPSPAVPAEPAPTDLSHLSGENTQPPPPEVYTPPVAQPENLVVPQTSPIPESINASPSGSKLSKVFIIVGFILILGVSAASAYFFLGIGKKTQPSSPANQQPLTTPPRDLLPSPSPEESEQTATGSSDFSNLTNSPTHPASASASPSSALERLRQRQQSPTP
ncbi:hypothetical protein HYS93_00095 [Candidatus Daviesbacteria bacterium]|nr:hypothetical protein [Candidatus Daviesbacteria bacterium]